MTGFPGPMLIIGCGNMAGAMLRGWIAAGRDPKTVTVVDPFAKNLPDGVVHHESLDDYDGAPDLVLLGVKPQMLADLAPELAKLDLSNATIVSILAGVECETLARRIPGAHSVVRLMPNMAVSIRKSVMALYAADFPEDRRDPLEAMMAELGLVEWLAEEDHMHLFTALAGSGPAYVFRFIDALAEGASALGMEQGQAARFALAMVEGAALLAADSDDSPGVLADKVASPGGTTREGLNVLDEDRAVFRLAEKTLAAAARRSAEMAEELKG